MIVESAERAAARAGSLRRLPVHCPNNRPLPPRR